MWRYSKSGYLYPRQLFGHAVWPSDWLPYWLTNSLLLILVTHSHCNAATDGYFSTTRRRFNEQDCFSPVSLLVNPKRTLPVLCTGGKWGSWSLRVYLLVSRLLQLSWICIDNSRLAGEKPTEKRPHTREWSEGISESLAKDAVCWLI